MYSASALVKIKDRRASQLHLFQFGLLIVAFVVAGSRTQKEERIFRTLETTFYLAPALSIFCSLIGFAVGLSLDQN